MKIVVTGASGHIGNCLVRKLLENGAEIRVLMHNFENDLAKMNIEIMKGNILDQRTLKGLCEGADTVFHLAARISIDNRQAGLVYAANVTGTENMIRTSMSAGVRRFIHFSSIDAFRADPENQELDESRPLVESAKNFYGYTKALSEKLVTGAAREGLDAVILSPTAVVGPFDWKKSFLGQALIRMYRQSLPFLVEGGYNWVDVRDVVNAAINSVEKGRKGEKYILSGSYCTIGELSEIVSKISGNRQRAIRVPIQLAKMAAPLFPLLSSLTGRTPLYTSQSLDLLVHSPKIITFRKAERELGYHPRPLELTLRDTFEWFKENNYLK